MPLAFSEFDPAQIQDGIAFYVTAEDDGHPVLFRIPKLTFADELKIADDVVGAFLKRRPQVINACELAYARWRNRNARARQDAPIVVTPEELRAAAT